MRYVVIGLGVNTRVPSGDFPEELRGIVRNAKDVTVTVRDERASLKAYDKLIDMLEDEDITFVEEN